MTVTHFLCSMLMAREITLFFVMNPKIDHLSYSIYLLNAFVIAETSSMQDIFHL